jgi:hypothetical protein
VGKTGEDTIFEMKAKVAVRQRSSAPWRTWGDENIFFR